VSAACLPQLAMIKMNAQQQVASRKRASEATTTSNQQHRKY
jgi:hypothetical protein